jgi:hypothetical protein
MTSQVEASFLSEQMNRTGAVLRRGAVERIEDYESRFSVAAGVMDDLLRNLLVADFDVAKAGKTAEEFFGTSTIPFAAVDGTEYARQMFDLIIFFGGAYVSAGKIHLLQSEKPGVEYTDGFLRSGKGISSCVPLYVNEVLEVEPALEQTGTMKPLDSKAIYDNSRIADWIMAFSEFYLAYRLIVDQHVRLLLMDRSLSGELTALLSDTSHVRKKSSTTALLGLTFKGKTIDWLQLYYGRYRFINDELDLPAPRGDTLRSRILYTLEAGGPLTFGDICANLKIEEDDRRKRVKRVLDEMCQPRYAIVRAEGDRYALDAKYRDTWQVLRDLTESIGNQLFHADPKRGNPLAIEKNGSTAWLTTVDLAFLTLFCLYMIIEECWKQKVLLVGITKDTAARDFRRQVVPVCLNAGVWKTRLSMEELAKIPNTDRMFLQSVSIFQHDRLPTPWSLVEYDTAFRTIVPEHDGEESKVRPDHVGGAVQNRISPERLFVKSYVQLAQAEYDSKLRSNVLLIDRLAYPEFDVSEQSQITLRHVYGGADEPLRLILYSDKKMENRMQNLVMTILHIMTSRKIPEAFGHNVPLFIADNVAKWHMHQFRNIVDTTKQWIVSNSKLRSFVFYMSTFRERRAEIESYRREPA